MPAVKKATKRKAPLKPSQILQRALALLGGGKRWIKGAMELNGSYCAMGAMDHIDTPREPEATNYLIAALPNGVPNKSVTVYNDNPGRRFKQIESLFLRAIKAAKKKGD